MTLSYDGRRTLPSALMFVLGLYSRARDTYYRDLNLYLLECQTSKLKRSAGRRRSSLKEGTDTEAVHGAVSGSGR